MSTIYVPIADAELVAEDLAAFLSEAQPEERSVRIEALRTQITRSAEDADEQVAFNSAWRDFASAQKFETDTEANQSRAGFIDGWVRARRVAGMRTQFFTSQETRDGVTSDAF